MQASQAHRKPVQPGYQGPPLPLHPDPYSHSRSRTTSSNTLPTTPFPPHAQQLYPNNMQIHNYSSRRTPSNATFSTTTSGGNGPVPFRPASQELRRSTSSRSGGMQPLSYVALMRKQKATVWCDRAQHEDPRLVAQQKAAKIRAAMEVVGGPAAGRISTSGSNSLVGSNRVTAKIRHHGKAGLVGYSPGDLVGGVGGVPMRLSASEVEGGDSDDDADSGNLAYGGGPHHQRSGSGRSSVGSGRRGLTYPRQPSSGARWNSGNTPPSERKDSMDDVQEAGETPVPGTHHRAQDYFTAEGNGDGTQSTGSAGSGERGDVVGELNAPDAARLASNKSAITREKSLRNPDELRRRGSVDERTMTISAGRLYIANPDADSD